MDRFDFAFSCIEGVGVATPVGEVDMVTAASLRRELSLRIADGELPIVVRLDLVSHLDATGVQALVAGYREALLRGISYLLAAPREQAAKELSLSSAAVAIPRYTRLRDALEAAGKRTPEEAAI